MLTERKYSLYRPLWTCGRYDSKSKTAIYYNLLSGKSYLFEDSSAEVISEVLSIGRGKEVSLECISKKTQLPKESLNSFAAKLVSRGLLSEEQPSKSAEMEYRNSLKRNRIESTPSGKLDELVGKSQTAEMVYATRAKCPVTTVLIELTYRCSEKCIHCYNPGASRNEEEPSQRHLWSGLSFKDYVRIIDQLYDMGTVRVCLSGGDPFSSPHAWDIINYLYEKEFAIEVYTNGQSLDGKTNKLASYYPCVVGLSLYSSVEDVHDKITRTKGSFNRTIKILKSLSELSVPLEVKCCVMRLNLKSYRGVSKIASKYGAKLQLESSIFDSMDGDKCISKTLRLTEPEMELTLRDKENPLYIGPELENYGAKYHPMDKIVCSGGKYGICVTPDGKILPCVSYHAVLGDITKSSLYDIMYNNPIMDKLTSLFLEKYEECGRHPYCDYCNICPGLNFSEHGTPLKAAENNCYVAKVRYELAQKLREGQDPLNNMTIDERLYNAEKFELVSLSRIQGVSHYDEDLKL